MIHLRDVADHTGPEPVLLGYEFVAPHMTVYTALTVPFDGYWNIFVDGISLGRSRGGSHLWEVVWLLEPYGYTREQVEKTYRAGIRDLIDRQRRTNAA